MHCLASPKFLSASKAAVCFCKLSRSFAPSPVAKASANSLYAARFLIGRAIAGDTYLGSRGSSPVSISEQS